MKTIKSFVKKRIEELRDYFEDSRALVLLAMWLVSLVIVLLIALLPPEGKVSYYYRENRYAEDGIHLYTGSADYFESGADAAETVNINTASVYDLAGILPGIGEKKARAIVERRESIGDFRSVDELIEVPGISDSLLEKIRPFCRVSDDTPDISPADAVSPS